MIVVRVTVTDDAGLVTEELVRWSESSYGYETERMFEALGKQVAKKVDPNYDG